jgi:hypothetical protein
MLAVTSTIAMTTQPASRLHGRSFLLGAELRHP